MTNFQLAMMGNPMPSLIQRITDLEAELVALRTSYANMAERCGGQSLMITRLIEGKVPLEPELIESCRQYILKLSEEKS